MSVHRHPRARIKQFDDTNSLPPTEERLAHHVEVVTDFVEDEVVQRIKSGVLALFQSGDIGDAEVVASERWYRDWAASEFGARVESLSSTGGGSPGGVSDAVLFARTAYREATQALGVQADMRLRLFVGHGMSLRKIAKGLEMANQTRLAGMVIADLQALAAHYERVDIRA